MDNTVANVLLVAGTNHQKPALALRDALQADGHTVAIVTAKTSRDVLRQQVGLSPAVVWFANPQTTTTKPYVRLYQALQKQGLDFIPVAVSPYQSDYIPQTNIRLTRNFVRVAEEISVQLPVPAPSTGGRGRFLAGVAGLVILLAMMAGVFAVATNSQPAEAMPTLVTLDVMTDSTDLVAEATAEASTVISETTPEIEATTEIEATEETTDAEATVEVEVTADVESTEEVETLTTTPIGSAISTTENQETLRVDFAVDIPRGDAPLVVTVTNLSSGSIQSVQWDYETDGVVDSTAIQPPPITYNQPGVYTLTLTIIDTQNRALQSQKTIEVYANNTAQTNVSSGSAFASFRVVPSSGVVPLSVQFTNRTIGNNLTYRWDFNGDGNIDFEGVSPPTYTYSQVGTYNARLEVVTEGGARDSAQAQINVYASSPDDTLQPIYDVESQADFSVSPTSGVLPLRVDITNQSVGENNNYEWDFDGDGEVDSASAQPPSQQYAIPGTYTITLTVKGFDRFGASKISRAQTQVVVLPLTSNATPTPAIASAPLDLFADFSVDVFDGLAPLTVQYYNYSSGDNTSYQWDFDGDGVIDSTEFEPIFTFNSGGLFESILYVNDGASSDVTSLEIEVTPAQVIVTATATPSPTVVVIDEATPVQTSTMTPSATLTTEVVDTTPIPTETLDPVTQEVIFTATMTPTSTPTLTFTPTPTPTITPSLTPTATFTHTPTPTLTFTVTPSMTPTATHTATDEPAD